MAALTQADLTFLRALRGDPPPPRPETRPEPRPKTCAQPAAEEAAAQAPKPADLTRDEFKAYLAAREDPELAWPDYWWSEAADPGDIRACRALWSAALLGMLRDIVLALRRACGPEPTRERVEHFWPHEAGWLGSRDFVMVCDLAGVDAGAVFERMSAIRSVPERMNDIFRSVNPESYSQTERRLREAQR